MTEKYVASFTLTAPAKKGNLVLLLKALLELQEESGLAPQSIARSGKTETIIGWRYQDAMEVALGRMSEEEYVRRNCQT